MNNFDNTKENIRIRELDKSDRKALFNKFKEAGGEVIKESKIKKPIRIDRNKQRDLISKLEKRSTQMSQRIPAKTSQQTKSSKNIIQNKAKTKKKKSRVLGSFLDKTLIKFKLYFFNVADFHTFALTEKFFNRFEVEYKTALVELQVIYLDIFKKIPHIGEEIIEQLDRMSPLYFELIEKSADLYNRITTDKIIDKYLTYPTDKHKISDYKEPILEYFRKLYILHNFQDTIFSAFDKAIAIHAKKLNKKV